MYKRRWVAGLIALPLMACSQLDVIHPPGNDNNLENHPLLADIPEQLPDATGAEESLAARWWQSFNDPVLNELVELALTNNFSLQASLARIEQSAALLRVDASGQYSELNLQAGRSRVENSALPSGRVSNNWSAGLNASYEIDFWGSVAAARDQGEFELSATQSAARIQANTVASQVSNAWYGYLKESRQLELLVQQKQRVESGLKAINARFQRGRSQVSDVWQQQSLLESIEADVFRTKSRRDIFRNQLQLWLGAAVSADQVADALQTALSRADQTLLPVVLPEHRTAVSLQAISERPDVQQAWFDVLAANAGVAIAEANRYPRFTLTASYSGQDPDFSNVFDDWVSNVAANLVLPLIDGGERRAQVAAQQALLQQTLDDYQQTLLEAADEVQQQLIREQEYLGLDASLNKQLELERKTESFQASRYAKGVGDFLSLLTSQRDVLSLERQVLENQLSAVQSRIGLYQAVSHGRFLPDSLTSDSLTPKPSTSESSTSRPKPSMSTSLKSQSEDNVSS